MKKYADDIIGQKKFIPQAYTLKANAFLLQNRLDSALKYSGLAHAQDSFFLPASVITARVSYLLKEYDRALFISAAAILLGLRDTALFATIVRS